MKKEEERNNELRVSERIVHKVNRCDDTATAKHHIVNQCVLQESDCGQKGGHTLTAAPNKHHKQKTTTCSRHTNQWIQMLNLEFRDFLGKKRHFVSLALKAVKWFEQKGTEILPVVAPTAAALLLKMSWCYTGPEKVRCSVQVLFRCTGLSVALVLKLLGSAVFWIYITAHFFSTGGALPSAFSISTMILLKISTAVWSGPVSTAWLISGSTSRGRPATRPFLPHFPLLKIPWTQLPRSRQVSFPLLAGWPWRRTIKVSRTQENMETGINRIQLITND